MKTSKQTAAISKLKKPPLCKICRQKPAKSIRTKLPGNQEYVNASLDPIFCSLRCAANWALLWYVPVMEDS